MTDHKWKNQTLPTALILLALALPMPAAQSNGKDVSAVNDLDRPTYHFQPPKNWMNDPKPFFHKGEYHIFFQYNPNAPYPERIHWGHAVSRDLAHWTQLPDALTPTPDGPDKDGCWTGCTVEKDGVYHILYTGVQPQVQCLATSKDMVTWEKYRDNPVIAKAPEGFGDCWRDPCAWKESDAWYMVIGSQRADTGAALLYRSSDLIHWEYLHPLYTGDKAVDGIMFECPDFFALGAKHVLLSSCGVTFWRTGRYDQHKFTMEKHGVTDGGHFYAAKTLLDGKGRRILWGWVTEGRPQEECTAAGWSGVLSLPRALGIRKDGALSISPVPELKALRGAKHAVSMKTDSVKMLDDIRGQALEVIARFKPNGAKRIGLVLRSTADQSECTSVYADQEQKLLVAEDAKGRRVQAPFEVTPGEEITLHAFLDHSVIEVFANDRACLTARSYTQRPDADHIGIFSAGPAECSLEAWEIGNR